MDERIFLRSIRVYGQNLITFTHQYAYDLPSEKMTASDL